MIRVTSYNSPIGEMVLGSLNQSICLCDWKYRKQRNQIDDRISRLLNADFVLQSDPLLKKLKNELDLYFSGKIQSFNFPLTFAGTSFQKEVWNTLLKIPYGETWSYAKLSLKINNPEAIRAVASANGANAISILVPCHRVVGSDGSLTGYAGGISAKKSLLQLEGAAIYNQQSLF